MSKSSLLYATVRNSLYCLLLHNHCASILAPSTLKHIGEKLLQLAATNCTDGGSFNTRYFFHQLFTHWQFINTHCFQPSILIAPNHQYSLLPASLSWRLYWNLVIQKKTWLKQLLKESSKHAPNDQTFETTINFVLSFSKENMMKREKKRSASKGFIFSFEEFQRLLTTEWTPACGTSFVAWITARFPAISLLLGALRSEQFDRFRIAGLKGVTFNYDNHDNHQLHEKQCDEKSVIKESPARWQPHATPE